MLFSRVIEQRIEALVNPVSQKMMTVCVEMIVSVPKECSLLTSHRFGCVPEGDSLLKNPIFQLSPEFVIEGEVSFR